MRLQDYNFPGNARELENIIERSLAICGESDIEVHHLPAELGNYNSFQSPSANQAQTTAPAQSLEDNEREYILSVLKKADGNKTQAAKIIGIDRVSLWRKIKRYKSKGYNVEKYLEKKD
jgi:transcriptional regulator with PAS, ATPase and Fis domain